MNEPQGVRPNTNSSHTKIQVIRDASHLAILLATRSFPLQVRNSNLDGAIVSYRIASINCLRVQAALKRLTSMTS